MKTISKALAVCAVAAVLAMSGSAWADGYRHRGHDGGYYDGAYALLGYGLKHRDYHRGYRGDYHRGHHAHRKHHAKRHYGGRYHHRKGYAVGKHRHRHGYRGKGRAKHAYGCHPVSKVRWYRGRKARFGGTLCYDPYGHGYIVPGSRYLIGYLY